MLIGWAAKRYLDSWSASRGKHASEAQGPPGTARLAVKWAIVSLTLIGTVEDGRLVLRPDGNPTGRLSQVYEGVDGWVGSLNGWLAAHGYRLAPLQVSEGRIALRKERVAGAADR